MNKLITLFISAIIFFSVTSSSAVFAVAKKPYYAAPQKPLHATVTVKAKPKPKAKKITPAKPKKAPPKKLVKKIAPPNWAAYSLSVQNQIRPNWHQPASLPWDPAKPLKAAYMLNIMSDGQLVSRKLKQSSGNTAFDLACQRAIDQSPPFSPLPKAFKQPHVIIGYTCIQHR